MITDAHVKKQTNKALCEGVNVCVIKTKCIFKGRKKNRDKCTCFSYTDKYNEHILTHPEIIHHLANSLILWRDVLREILIKTWFDGKPFRKWRPVVGFTCQHREDKVSKSSKSCNKDIHVFEMWKSQHYECSMTV